MADEQRGDNPPQPKELPEQNLRPAEPPEMPQGEAGTGTAYRSDDPYVDKLAQDMGHTVKAGGYTANVLNVLEKPDVAKARRDSKNSSGSSSNQ